MEIKDIILGEIVTIKGWVYSKRSSKDIHFLQLRDGSGTIQAVAHGLDEKTMDLCEHISTESSVVVTGAVCSHPKFGTLELKLLTIELIGDSKDYPITPKEHGVDFLMEHRHLWLRSPRQVATLKIRSQIEKAITDFMFQESFTRVDAPILTPSSAEGTSTLFETDYFGEKAFLSQSGQLYLEAAAMALGKVYCFGPTFRAEKSKTRKHLTEFWMLEVEKAFWTLEENIDFQEDLICYIFKEVLNNCQKELQTLERDTGLLENIKKPFWRLPYIEAVAMNNLVFGEDLGAEQESYISTHPCFEGKPIFIYGYPAACKAFYMQPSEQATLSVDCIAPEDAGEIIGGSMRIDDEALLTEKIKQYGLSQESLDWYVDLRRYGSVPHGGFGLGLERLVSWICGLHHVREAIPFARTTSRIYP